MKILVTGGAGFIGGHLVEELLRLDHEVFVVDDFSTGNRKNLGSCFLNPKFKYKQMKIQNLDSMYGEYDALYHLAALPRVQLSIDQPLVTNDANVTGSLAVFNFARNQGIKKVFYACSSSVYGEQQNPLYEGMKPNPLNPYAMQKYMGELYLQLYSQMYGFDATSFRFFNVYGERMAEEGSYKLVFMNWVEAIRKGEQMQIFGDGEQTRDFTYVGDVVNALVLGLYKQKEGFNVYNVGSGKQTSLNRLAELFGHAYRHVAARPFEERAKEADVNLIKEDLGWKPEVFIEEGIERIKKYYGI